MRPLSAYPRVRPRRTRRTTALRSMVRETLVTPADLIQPLFVFEGSGPDEAIPSMPGQFRLSLPAAVERCVQAWEADHPHEETSHERVTHLHLIQAATIQGPCHCQEQKPTSKGATKSTLQRL